MEQLIFQQIRNELVNGSVKKGHPFKYFTLGTLENNNVHLRTVVLRKTYADLTLLFYTDKRSKKVAQIQNNNKVNALFYHPNKLMQLQVKGTASIQENPEVLRNIWHSIPPKSRKDYTTVMPPGVKIDDPDSLEYLLQKDYFCMIEIVPQTIEYLKLKHPNHIRLRYTRQNQGWNGEFLVP